MGPVNPLKNSMNELLQWASLSVLDWVTSWLESCLCVLKVCSLPSAGCVSVSRRFGLAWPRSAVLKLQGARWWEVALACGVRGTLLDRVSSGARVSPQGSRGELWPGWWPGRMDMASPPCFWNQGRWSERLLPGCGLVPQRLPCRAPWTEVFPSSPRMFSCSSSWFWLQISCALGVPFFPGRSAFFLSSLASVSKTPPGISAPSSSVYAVRPQPWPVGLPPGLRSPAVLTAFDSFSR